MRVERWFVTIDHLTDEQLGFLGYTLVEEREDFKIYRDYSGEHHIVSKHGKQFLYVDDINDAAAMNSDQVMRVTLEPSGDY